IQLSSSKFFRNVRAVVDSMHVISARTFFEAQFPGSPLCWKSAAFAYIMHEHFLDMPLAPKLVLSIGDSNEEKVALKIAAAQHTNMTTKAVKFIPGPGPQALVCQLDFVSINVESILMQEGDAELGMEPEMIKGHGDLLPQSCGIYNDSMLHLPPQPQPQPQPQ
ncbi:unnamed protein product, partial [Discosporangium mesarthrocarpum]